MFNNERDVEVPAMLKFIEDQQPWSLLDVGAHGSHTYYAHQLRKLVGRYDGIDIAPDPETAVILDEYVVGNVLEYFSDRRYDCVMCLSTLEHCGISTYQVEHYRPERDRVFEKCLGLARDCAWFSFPVGKPYFLPNEFANITRDCLEGWEHWAGRAGWDISECFYYLNDDNQSPRTRGYRQVSPDVALEHEYDLSRIQQSFCIMGLTRGA